MDMALILTVLIVAVLLAGNELWWRQQGSHSEWSRKIVHVTVGSFVAFWPFFLSWNQIRWLSLSFVIGVGISNIWIFLARFTASSGQRGANCILD